MLRGIIVIVAQLLCLIGLPSRADHVPQSCYDGRALMGDDVFAAIDKLTECINSTHSTSEVAALAYYNRAASYLGAYYNEPDLDLADTYLEYGSADIERAIENVDPSSFLIGFGYGIFTIAVIVLFVFLCKYVCEKN